MRLPLDLDVLLDELAAQYALFLFQNINVIGDLELSGGLSNKYVVLVGCSVKVEKDLNILGTTCVVAFQEALEVCPN